MFGESRVVTVRYHYLLVLALAPLVLSAAPVPKNEDAEKLRRIYGTWTDPDKDCKYVLKGEELRISIPKDDHQMYSGHMVEPPKNNAPRALRDVDGDFSAVVRVIFPVPEVPKGQRWPYCSGGLVAWESDARYLVVRRAGGLMIGDSEGIVMHHAAATSETAHKTFKHAAKRPESAFVRLKREGDKVIPGWSRDGKKWEDFDSVEVGWRARIKVGIVAENTLGTPVEITFDQYSLTQPKK